MRYLTNDYQKVYTHKGNDICVLKVANPSNGDPLGYSIDDAVFARNTFNDITSAIVAIDQKVRRST